ncbi:DASH complex subunit Dad3-domain-containing protein [Limtongia smithiae]|uniref:DASH complex subunit Dad3-domain-containing protein n=1 Tax=Limtongia smithiae TaxID=1125753 RepID=UPI0034CF8734
MATDTTGAISAQPSTTLSPDILTHLLSPVEQELLAEYQLLSTNLATLASQISTLATSPTPELIDKLRELERKTAIVFTLLKASVYSIFLQQQLHQEYQRGPEEQI